MQNVDVLTLLLRWLHVLAAMAAFGGALYMRFAVLPAAHQTLDESTREKLREQLRARWARFVHGAIGVLLVTGVINIVRFSMSSDLPPMPYHAIFGVKVVLALVVFFVATVVVGRSPAFERARQRMGAWLSALIVVIALIVLLSGMLNQLRLAGRGTGAPPAVKTTTEG